MTHAEMDVLYDLYVLGALEWELAAEIEQHLRDECSYCLEHIEEANGFTATLAGIAEVSAPSAELRKRVLATVTPVRPKRSLSWLYAAAALAAVCLVLMIWAVTSRSQLQQVRDQLALAQTQRDELRVALERASSRMQTPQPAQQQTQIASGNSERDELRRALSIMRQPETRSVRFGKPAQPHGWLFASRNGGLVLVGSQLPRVANNRTLELWLVPKTGAPRPAGLFRPSDAAGSTLTVSTLAVDRALIKAVAVSDEPRAGSQAPTTKPFLLVPTS